MRAQELSGTVALVVGAGPGVGRACALAFAEAGADVVVAARRAEPLAALAAEVAAAGYRDLLVVSILKGSFVFAADLLRALHDAGLAPEVEFMSLSSYRAGTVSADKVRVVRDIETDVRGRDVLIVDDILESGRTLAYARDLLVGRGATRVDLAVLLDKPGKRATEISAQYVGFECPDYFVVGYGMDVAHAFRELPYVARVMDGP